MAANHKLLVEDFRRAEADRRAAVARKEIDADAPNPLVVSLREGIESGHLKPGDFDFGKLFIESFGLHDFYAVKAGKASAQEVMQRVSEADGGVTTAAFQNISGQILYSAARVGYMSEDFVFAKLIPEDDAIILDGEKIPGITDVGNAAAVRKENDPYIELGFGEDWIFTPPVPDVGGIISLTWEAVFNDRTGDVMGKAQNGGYSIGLYEEIAAIDATVDENVTAHRYNWRSAGQIATYGDNSGTHSWDNLTATNALVDWTDLDGCEQTANAVVNPFTGLPILTELTDLIVTKQLEQTANRIVSATEIRVTTPGYATSANPNQAVQKNPYLNKYTVRTSRLLAQRMATDTSWFLANLNRALLRKVAEPLNTVRAPSNTKDDFERRVVARFRSNKRFAHVVREPRLLQKNTA
jgi:hypothetical protein